MADAGAGIDGLAVRMHRSRHRVRAPGAAEDTDDVAAAGFGIGGGGHRIGHTVREGVGFAHYAARERVMRPRCAIPSRGNCRLRRVRRAPASKSQRTPTAVRCGVAYGAGEGLGGAVVVAFGCVADDEVQAAAGARVQLMWWDGDIGGCLLL